MIDEYVFHPKKLTAQLFKLSQAPMGAVLCVQGLSKKRDDFKTIVEKEKLTGRYFREVWSSS